MLFWNVYVGVIERSWGWDFSFQVPVTDACRMPATHGLKAIRVVYLVHPKPGCDVSHEIVRGGVAWVFNMFGILDFWTRDVPFVVGKKK